MLEQATAWEIIAARTDPRFVRFEVDLQWALKALGNQDALAIFLQNNRGRIDLLHVKDLNANSTVTNPGDGILDLRRLIRSAGGGVKYYIWEYERPYDPMGSAKRAWAYLRCK